MQLFMKTNIDETFSFPIPLNRGLLPVLNKVCWQEIYKMYYINPFPNKGNKHLIITKHASTYPFNPSNAEVTFIQNTKMQRFLKTI